MTTALGLSHTISENPHDPSFSIAGISIATAGDHETSSIS